MGFTIERSDHRAVVRLTGRLDVVTVNKITLDFTRGVAMHRLPTVVDLSAVDFIASLGMGMLVANAQALQRHGLRMVPADPQPLVAQALSHAGLECLIPVAHGAAEVEARLAG